MKPGDDLPGPFSRIVKQVDRQVVALSDARIPCDDDRLVYDYAPTAKNCHYSGVRHAEKDESDVR